MEGVEKGMYIVYAVLTGMERNTTIIIVPLASILQLFNPSCQP
jgi:hypothetical protein